MVLKNNNNMYEFKFNWFVLIGESAIPEKCISQMTTIFSLFPSLPHVSLLHVWSSHTAAVKTASQVFQISAEVLQQRKSLLSFQTAEPLHRKTLHHLRAAVRAMKSFELKDFIYKHHEYSFPTDLLQKCVDKSYPAAFLHMFLANICGLQGWENVTV